MTQMTRMTKMSKSPLLLPILAGALIALTGCPTGSTGSMGTPTPPVGTAPATQPSQPAAEQPAAQPAPEPVAEPQELAFPEEEFRNSQPPGATPRPLQIPDIQTFKLKNGMTVYLVERNELPVVSVEINIDGGAMNDPKGKEGLASVCMDMMSEGTEKLDKIAFEEALADIASNISSYAGRETQGVSFSTLTKHFDETYQLYLDTLFTPAFRQADFDRMIKRRLESLKQAKGSPGSIARRVADRILYGPKHPFGRITTEDSLKALKVEDCVAYHKAYVKPRGARLFVVGKMSEKQIRDKFGAKALASWKGKPKRSVRLPAPRPMKGKLFFVHVDDAEQSQINVMHFGPKRKARDYFATTAASRILGGGFTSRLNMNLREDKGYSYGARGGFGYSRNYGEFNASTSVRTDSTWQSVQEIYDEIVGLKTGKEPATEAELERERNSSILSLPGQFATMNQVLGSYRSLVYYGLPLDYYNKFVDKVRKVTLQQVRAAARKHLKPNKAIILVVGNADSVQKQRKGSEDVALVDADGKPVTLKAGLAELLKKGEIGKGKLVVLDADGNVVE